MQNYILIKIDNYSGKRSQTEAKAQSIDTLRKRLIKTMNRDADLYDICKPRKDARPEYMGTLFFMGKYPYYRKGLSNRNSDLVRVDPKTGKLME